MVRHRRPGYGAGVQRLPPSVVVNLRSSVVVTVADDASVAATSTKSALAGGVMVLHFFPSVVSRMIPLRPTSQQVSTDGAAPAMTCAFALVHCTRQVEPASLDRSTKRPLDIRHSTSGSGEWTTVRGLRSSADSTVTVSLIARPRFAVTTTVCWLRARSG